MRERMMKKRSLKRRISLLLVVALVVTSFPAYVFGYENANSTQPASSAEDSLIKYDPNYKGKIEIVEELPFKRGEFEKHFVNTDGSMIAVSYPEAVHYQVNGTWEDIDSRLVVKDKEKGLYGPAASDLQVLLPGSAIADILVPATKPDEKDSIIKLSSNYLTKVTDGEYAISWNILGNSKDYTSDFLSKATSKTLDNELLPISTLTKSPQLDFSTLSHDEQETALPNLVSTALYKNIVKNVDLSVTVTPNKLKENLILSSPKGFESISYLIDAGNLIGKINDDNSVYFSNERGNVVFIIPTPLMLDSNTIPEESMEIDLALEKTKAGYILTLTPDAKWLNDPARVYPVTIDPTVTTSRVTSNILDTYIHSGDSAGDHKYSSYIKLNKTDGATCRGYIDFANRPTIDTNLNDIVGGDLIGYLVSGTSTYHSMTVYQPTAAWTTGSITWANRPSNSAAITTKNGVLSGSYYKYTFPVDASVKSWYSTGVQNGYMIKYTDETIDDYNYFYASDHPTISSSYYPCMVIEYTPDATLPVISSFTTNPATTSSAYTTNDNPVLSWSITENHLTEVQYAIGSGSYTKISSSKTGTYTIPDGKITTSGTYSIKLRAKDASGNYSAVSTKSYYFDVNAPTKTTTPPNSEPQVKFTPSGSNIIVDVWVSDAHSGLLNYKVGSTGTLTTITSNPYKISYTVPASDPIRTLYVYDKVGKLYSETFNPGDLFAPNAPSVIQTGNGVEIVDNGDITNGSGSYRDASGNLCLSNKIYYKVNGGSYVTLQQTDAFETGRYLLDLDRNVDNTVVVKAEDTYTNVCSETSYTIPKEIGIYKESVTDISYDQLAAPLSITRSYKSNTNTWAFSFESKVVAATTDRILTLTLQNGEKEYFIYDDATDIYIGATSGAEMTIASGYYYVEIDGYYFKYRTSDGKIYAIYLNSSASSPIAQYSYDASGTHIAIGSHTINIDTTKTSIEVKKGTETLVTVTYAFTSGQLISATDAMGKITGYTYSGSKLTQESLGDGSNTYTMKTIAYGTSGQVSSITNRNGSNVAITYAASTNPDTPNDTIVTEDYSDDTLREYAVSRTLAITELNQDAGTGAPTTEPDVVESITETYVDADGITQERVIREKTSDNVYIYYNYDSNNRVVGVGRLNNPTTPPDTYSLVGQSNFNELTLTTYNTAGLVTQETYKKIISGTQVQISQTAYTYDSWNRVSTRTDTSQSGVVTVSDYTYNGFGLVTEEEVTIGSGTPKATTYCYDQYGAVLKQNDDGDVTRTLYDSFGRLSKEISSKYYASGSDSLTTNTEKMASNSGTYSGTTNTTRYTFNNTTWNLSQMIDRFGTTTNYTYDAVGNLTKQEFDLYTVNQNVKGDLTNIKVGAQDLVDYSYDTSGNLSTKAFENGQSISYTYSGKNIATISYGSTLSFEFTYTDGVLTSKIDHINNTTTNYSGDTVEVSTAGNVISSYNQDTAYENDGSAYQVLTETNGTDTYTTQSHENYDVFGLSGGSNSLYKSFSRTDGRVDSTNVKLNSLTGTTLMATNYSYTGDNLTQVSNVIGSTTKAFDYTYDSEDRISKVSCGSDDVNYFYDSKDQLIRVNDEILNKTFTYSYDSRGNMTSKSIYAYTTADPINGTPTSTDTYSYGDSNWPDKLTSYNGQAITYDANGNPLSYKGYTMSWVGGRMLDSMVGNGKSIYFNYDDQGIRTQKTVNGTVTKYTTIDGRITSQKDGTNTMYFHYDQNNELTGAMINGNEYLYVRNLQGDIVSLVDTAGNIVVNYSYDSWGKVESITGSQASTIGAINPMRYRGYYQDAETGLYYLQSRYYDPDTCRMINADEPETIAIAYYNLANRNGYSYCLNSPISNVDPTGYWVQNMKGWSKKDDGFVVDIDGRFLLKSFCKAFAFDVLLRYGTWSWLGIRTYKGMGLYRIAIEIYAHAVGYYGGRFLQELGLKASIINQIVESGRQVHVNYNDKRYPAFVLVWYA